MKVLLADNIHQAAVELLEKKAEIIDAIGVTTEELNKKIEDVDAVLVRSKPKLTSDILKHAKNLKVIGRAGVGVDNIDVDFATKKGIIVVNAPEASTTTVAEHAFGLLLALARKIPAAVANVKSGGWEKKKFMGVEVRGKTLGVIGIGRIGSRVSEIGRAFGMTVIAYDPYMAKDTARKQGIELTDLDTLLKKSDFITLHIPKTEKTAGMMGKREFGLMKPTAYLINCARGGIVNEAALKDALANRKIAGAALDVFEKEPPSNSPLFSIDSFIGTPHLGASTEEAQENASLTTAKDILAVLENKTPKNAVNMPVISQEILDEIGPYLKLCESMGRFAIQLTDGRVEEISVVYCGKIREIEELSILTNTLLKSILAPILLNTINIVNSAIIAKDRGIKVVQGTRDNSEDFESIIILTIKTDTSTSEIRGILFGGIQPKIISIDDFSMDIVPDGNILIVKHEDRPGIIGNIATTLGHHGINIGSMHVGRKNVGGAQMMAMSIDQDLSEETLTSLTLVNGVSKVKIAKHL